MNRPLMQHGVGQLEQLFAASRSDARVLKQLETELRYRQVPRAVALLAEVQGALYSPPSQEPSRPSTGGMTDAAPKSDGVPKSPPVQPLLWTLPATQGGVAPMKQPELPLVSGGPAASSPKPASATPAPTSPAETEAPRQRGPASQPPLVTLADAYKLFKATPTSSWESIEQARKLAVQASSPTRLVNMPDSQRNAVREEAIKVNAAYEVLSRARSSSQPSS